jgi:hypothetical protein
MKRFAIIAAVAASVVFWGWFAWSQTRPAAVNLSTSAFVACKEFVFDRLKSPASAVFPTMNNATITKVSATSFEIRAYVDSQNSFGALIRTPYTCQVSRNGASWTLDRLDL